MNHEPEFDLEAEKAATRVLCYREACGKGCEGLWQLAEEDEEGRTVTREFCSVECVDLYREEKP